MDRRRLFWLLIAMFLATGSDAMSRQQLKNSGKMLKKNCMKKNDVTEDQVGTIDKGKFVEDKKVMCYIACIYEMTNVIKNNKLSYESSIKQIDLMYPPDLKDSAKAAVEHCKDIQKKYKDICEASFYAAKCMYEFKPEDFIFA
uniref:Odorant binding protein 7 n=1 Tax=Athetis dissimilis TaxID=1737331 RepID=A0A109YJX5_ATHDI|nr:odorant binding protein 7 [Athetis dissimilis]